MTVGEVIRRERERLDWTVYRLAKESGVSAQQLGRVERGERTITLPTAAKLCAAFGASLSVFDGLTSSIDRPPANAWTSPCRRPSDRE